MSVPDYDLVRREDVETALLTTSHMTDDRVRKLRVAARAWLEQGNAPIIQRSETGWPNEALNTVAEMVQRASRDGFVPLTVRYTLAADILDALSEGDQ